MVVVEPLTTGEKREPRNVRGGIDEVPIASRMTETVDGRG
jgi:hypothetical protein